MARNALARVDEYARADVTIASEHAHIHRGRGFTIADKITGLGAGASYEFLAQVPAGVFPHLRIYAVTTSGGPVDIELYEGTTFSAAGTTVTPQNNNRPSSATPSTVVTHTPTVTADGTRIDYRLIPSGHKEGGNLEPIEAEWVCAPDTDYLFRITNNDSSAVTLGVYLFWYELEPGTSAS